MASVIDSPESALVECSSTLAEKVAEASISNTNISPEPLAKRIKTDINDPSSQPPIVADELDELSSSSMLILPDLCLMHIFDSISMLDLYMASNVCVRFRQAAITVFHSRFRGCYFGYIATEKPLPAGLSKRSYFLNCVRIFRPLCIRIGLGQINETLETIVEYCTDIKAIDISGHIDNPNAVTALRSILPKLQAIGAPALQSVWNGLDTSNWMVESLHLYGHSNAFVPAFEMAQLKQVKFSFFGTFMDIPEYLVVKFLIKNRHIERLELKKCCISFKNLRLLTLYMSNLKELAFDHLEVTGVNDNDLYRIFEYAERVRIGPGSHNNLLFKLLIGAPVQQLDLFVDGKETLERLEQFDSITKLTLSGFISIDMDDVLDIIEPMMELEEVHLKIGTTDTIDLGDIIYLLEFIDNIDSLCITWNFETDFDPSKKELDDISTLVTAYPEISVRFNVPRTCVTSNVDELRPYANWLKLFDIEDAPCKCCGFDEFLTNFYDSDQPR